VSASRAIRTNGSPGLAACLGAEMVAGLLGFFGTIHLARRLEPPGFATLEIALAVAGWMLVLVRGGLDQIVVREAARHPRLIDRLTRLLIGLRLQWAVAGYAIIAAMAGLSGSGRFAVILASGLILFPSALVADIGPRARQELGFLALLQVIRAVGLIAAVFWFVTNPADLVFAAMTPAIAESVAALGFACRAMCVQGNRRQERGRPRSFRSRGASVLSKRAAVAGLARFGRVGLYVSDAMALGLTVGDGQGDYAAVRRVVFALVAVGVVLPALLGPALAQAKGLDAASIAIGRGLGILLGLFVPAALGLVLIADRGLPMVFGSKYEVSSLTIAIVASRLPILLVATWFQSALVALGREAAALGLTVVVGLIAVVTLPIAAIGFGTVGIALAILGIETIGAIGGWWLLGRSGVEPGRSVDVGSIAVGCLAMTATVMATTGFPLFATIIAGAVTYGLFLAVAHSVLKIFHSSEQVERLSLAGRVR